MADISRLRVALAAEALAHLLACLDRAVRLMDEAGMDVDARVVEAHRAMLARGREWPGDEVRSPFPEEEQAEARERVREACRLSPIGPVM